MSSRCPPYDPWIGGRFSGPLSFHLISDFPIGPIHYGARIVTETRGLVVEQGRNGRDLLAKEMTPADISKAQRLAREWLEEHRQ